MRLPLILFSLCLLAACSTADKYDHKVQDAEFAALFAGNTEFGEMIHPSDAEKEGASGNAYTAYYKPGGELAYRIGRGDVQNWRWRASADNTAICRGPKEDEMWCRTIEIYGKNLYRGRNQASGRHQYSFSIMDGNVANLGVQ